MGGQNKRDGANSDSVVVVVWYIHAYIGLSLYMHDSRTASSINLEGLVMVVHSYKQYWHKWCCGTYATNAS